LGHRRGKLVASEQQLAVQDDVGHDRREDAARDQERDRLHAADGQGAEQPGSSGLGSELGVAEVVDQDDQRGAQDRQGSRADLRPPAVGPAEGDQGLPHGQDRKRGEQDGLRDAIEEPLPQQQPGQPGATGVRVRGEPADQRERDGGGEQAGVTGR
jgi:hypothetical protein